MNRLNLNNVSINYGYGILFKNINFSLSDGEKICIVGPNGCGKTSLMKIIAGMESPDSGEVSIREYSKMAILEQAKPDNNDNRIVADVLKDAFDSLLKMQNEMEAILVELSNELDEKKYNKLLNRYGVLQEEFEIKGGYDIATRIDKICSGLKISDRMRSLCFNDLSGGEKVLINIAIVLLQKPDILLLDEPTNHLDIERIEWLEEYLKSFKGVAVLVSHDREFVDRVCNYILDLESGSGVLYHANYTNFLVEKKLRYEKQLELYNNQKREFDRLEYQAKRFADAGKSTNSTSMMRKATVMMRRLEREKDKADFQKPTETKKIKMSFSNNEDVGKRIIEYKDVTINGDTGAFLGNISFRINRGDRIAVVGKNGSGKSTILKSIVNMAGDNCDGEIYITPKIKIGYIPQIISFPNDNMTIFEYIQKEFGYNENKACKLITRFRFQRADLNKTLKMLSGGEKIRLKFLSLIETEINTLIFDEPTNHIDILTRESLEHAIDEFAGTVIVASHDRYFLNKFTDKFLKVSKEDTHIYIGQYTDYLKENVS